MLTRTTGRSVLRRHPCVTRRIYPHLQPGPNDKTAPSTFSSTRSTTPPLPATLPPFHNGRSRPSSSQASPLRFTPPSPCPVNDGSTGINRRRRDPTERNQTRQRKHDDIVPWRQNIGFVSEEREPRTGTQELTSSRPKLQDPICFYLMYIVCREVQ